MSLCRQLQPTLGKCSPSAGEHEETVTIDETARQVLECDQEVTTLIAKKVLSETAD